MKRLNAVVTVAALVVMLFSVGCQQNGQQPPADQTPQTHAPQAPFPRNQIPEAEQPVEPQPAPHEPALTEVPAAAGEKEPITTIEPEPAPAKPQAKKTAAKPKEKYATPKKAGRTYTVKEGDTLQKISMKFYKTNKNWEKIFQANKDKLKDPDELKVGMKLVIP